MFMFRICGIGALVIACGCSATRDSESSVSDTKTVAHKPASPSGAPTADTPATSGTSLKPEAASVSADDLERHAAKVRERVARVLPDATFHVIIEAPFVVVGDESEAMVRKRAEGTVRWSVERLQAAYFPRQPDHVIEVWLFGDSDSYMTNTRALFGETPGTPYGYYSSTHRALIMNIATGGGTLVHEIVHPFMAANFPACPAWFNEGMGSLYEQSGQRDGHIIGRTNWRLAGLQEALRDGRVPSFKTLTATTDVQFYDQDPGTNYAQARYLMYYLQEHGLLHDYYRRFHRNAATDPTGYTTLKTVLGDPDMDEFFAKWRTFVLGLRF